MCIRWLASLTARDVACWLRRTIRSICHFCLEAFCWLVIPAGFGFMLYLSYRTGHDATWMQFFLAVLALSPWLLRIFARYLEEFNISPSGVSGKIRQSVINSAELAPQSLAMAANEAPEGRKLADDFPALTLPAKKVLGTLWKYQVELFGPQDIRRWGFVVSPKSPDFHPFTLGALELMQKQLALFGPNGFLFLTNAGIEFCNKWNEPVAAQKELYSNFKGR